MNEDAKPALLTVRHRFSDQRLPWPHDPVQAADRLFALQAEENSGRGVSCVRAICFELRRADIDGAQAVADNDGDKIRSYPDIVAALKEVGLWWDIDFDAGSGPT